MNTCKKNPAILLIGLVFSGCLEPYSAPNVSDEVDLIVIDGFLDATDASARVRLTHVTKLSDENAPEPEINASVSLKNLTGDTFPLPEQEPGIYFATGIAIDPGAQYQLSVRTSDKQDYISDYVDIKPTPDIDNISWEARENGVNILVNTHDITGNTTYYAWNYDETWQYHAAVSSDYKLVNKVPVFRADNERIFTCYKSVPSTKISIASTERLAEDRISNYSLVFLPKGSPQLSVRYSILVKQRAVSKSEYAFLEQLQKTTESIGGLFDPQLSETIGNIHNLSNPSSIALGYFSAGIVKEKRIFIDYNELMDDLKNIPRPLSCPTDTICVSLSIPTPFECTLDLSLLSGSEIIGAALSVDGTIVGYTTVTSNCVDCRVDGGVLTKPTFWP